jgi:DNA-binding SARP family transcriptional activator
MGAGLARPMGTKKAKKLVQEDASISSFATASKALDNMAFSHRTLTKSMNLQYLCNVYLQMGNSDAANAVVKQLQELTDNMERDTTPSSAASSTVMPVQMIDTAQATNAESPGDVSGLSDNMTPQLENGKEEDDEEENQSINL